MKDLKQLIESQDWSFYGVTDAKSVKKALKKHRIVFDEWLKKGFQADMSYLERMEEDRFHPENKLPDVQSVIVLTAWYGIEQKMCSINGGRVARYAVGKDYHKVLKKKLIQLSDWLKDKNPDAHAYVSADSGPTVDRVLAEAAGLGFFGKNSMLINPARGSYFFIGSLLTTLKLAPTEKRRMPNCGNCIRCSVACPTGAIRAPGVIDANRCIAYLTIENKGGIPEELRPKIGNRLFGCDICQEVCPFNLGRAHRQEVLIEDLRAEYGVGESLDLKELFSISSDEDFFRKFAGTPLMRAKRRGLIRNACVVAGNSGNASLIPYLQKVINREEDEMLKEHAGWAINRLG